MTYLRQISLNNMFSCKLRMENKLTASLRSSRLLIHHRFAGYYCELSIVKLLEYIDFNIKRFNISLRHMQNDTFYTIIFTRIKMQNEKKKSDITNQARI